MTSHGLVVRLCASILTVVIASGAEAEQRTEHFDRDPSWEGVNNRSGYVQAVRQDFGYSAGTNHAGGEAGEIGGYISAAAESAYYAIALEERKTFDDHLTASGKLYVAEGGGHFLLGFFNAGTLNEWRTPNTLAIRIDQRGPVFHCHVEYCTSQWRAGAGIIGEYDRVADRMQAVELPAGRAYDWSMEYDPQGNGGAGQLRVSLGGSTVCDISPEHRPDGATFTHFGLVPVLKQWDEAGEAWLDDVTVIGRSFEFSVDPQWDSHQNRRTYETSNVRPRFDFGWSPTHHAGGEREGELGGLVFRGDCRYPQRLAAYGDQLEPLTLDRPLRASGTLSLHRAVSDSTVLLGFYHSAHSLRVHDSQDRGTPANFLGLAIDGPSSQGHFCYPSFSNHGGDYAYGDRLNPPYVYPDGSTHQWSLDYDPDAADGAGRITLTFDDQTVSMDLTPQLRAAGATFDRFGIVTTWIDGNGQHVFFDDMSYTVAQE